MALAESIRSCLTLPAICAPMYRVSNPALVAAACREGLIGVLPRQNVRELAQFEAWLGEVNAALAAHRAAHPEARIGPVGVNLSRMPDDVLADHLAVCRKHGIELYISAMGDPTELAKRVHDVGGKLFHDVTTIRFAEKAIAAGVDGLTCIGAGGGGHSGTLSPLALIPKVRAMFDGMIVMAGAVATGAAIRAAEILGADLAYLGTRFIATAEAAAAADYKDMLVAESAAGLTYTVAIAGAPANWLVGSLRKHGIDPEALADGLPAGVRPWAELWSAGQGIELIDDLPSVATLVSRLRREYLAACALPNMVEAARLAEQALEQG
jgi:nitronate monooxygenase